jgi:hypothetical protein
MKNSVTASRLGRVDLREVISAMRHELCCLLGPSIRLEIDSLPIPGPASVRARRGEIVDLLRHLALDERDAMPSGGTVTILVGSLDFTREGEAPSPTKYPTLIIQGIRRPSLMNGNGSPENREPFRKGRSLGLGASYDAIEQRGGHMHVSCGDGETTLTICFAPAGSRRKRYLASAAR